VTDIERSCDKMVNISLLEFPFNIADVVPVFGNFEKFEAFFVTIADSYCAGA